MNIFISLFGNFILLLYIFGGSLYIYSKSLVNLKNIRLNNNEKNPIIIYLSEIIPLIIYGFFIIFSTIELANIIKNI